MVLELISPAGLEVFFRALGTMPQPIDPDELAALAEPYHCDADMQATESLLARHELRF